MCQRGRFRLARLQIEKIPSEHTVAQMGLFLSVPNGTVPFVMLLPADRLQILTSQPAIRASDLSAHYLRNGFR